MRLLIVGAFLAVFSCSVQCAKLGACSIGIKELPLREPVYLQQKKGHHVLYEPTNQYVEVTGGEGLILFCPGQKNTVLESSKNTEQIACNLKFRQTLNKTTCDKQVRGDIQTTTTLCQLNGRHGYVYHIGFQVGSEFVQLFEVCYDYERAAALYSHHRLNGGAIKDGMHETKRVDFSKTGTPKSAKAVECYKIDNQIERFKKLIGRTQKYLTTKSYMARGHLTPDADFIFTTGQFATFFLANVVPQFQSINNGNWKSVESKTRNLAAQEQSNLEIYTGAYGRLTLLDDRGEYAPIYLSEANQIEAPEYIFKIAYNPEKHAAIVFITSNNPFIERKKFREFCPNVCDKANIKFDKQTARAGFTFCCSYEEFSRVVHFNIPLNVDKLLSMNS